MKHTEERDATMQASIMEWAESMPPYVQAFLDAKSVSSSMNTLRIYKHNLSVFFDWASKWFHITDPYPLDMLARISLSDAESYAGFLSRTYATRTALSALATVSTFFDYLHLHGHVPDNPFSSVVRPKIHKEPHVFLDGADRERFLATVRDGHGMTDKFLKQEASHGTHARNVAIVTVLLSTGMRISELIGLDLPDIDFERHRVTIMRKGGKTEHVYLSDDAESALRECIDGRELLGAGKKEQAIFLCAQGKNRGKRMSIQSADSLIKKYALAAGVANASAFSPHKLRHTCAMDVLDATGNIELVRKKLGHSSLSSTQVYAQARDSDLAAIRNIKA